MKKKQKLVWVVEANSDGGDPYWLAKNMLWDWGSLSAWEFPSKAAATRVAVLMMMEEDVTRHTKIYVKCWMKAKKK